MKPDTVIPGASPEPPLVLPEVFVEELSLEGLETLLTDLGQLAQVEVRLKYAAQGYTPDGSVSLEEGASLLRARKVRGAQFLYAHEGKLWSDTVLCGPETFRVVRMEQPTRPPSNR